VIFYFLLEPVNRVLALLAMAFGILSTALYAACEIFYFGLPHVLLGGADYLKTFTPDQLHSLTLASLRLFNHGAGLVLIFYGVGWIIRGSLMVRSRYFPKVLGLLMIAGGLGFVAHTVALVLAPGLATPFLLFLMAPGGVLLGLWLLIRGINVAQFEAAAKAAAVQI
jgi:hypothetical protein